MTDGTYTLLVSFDGDARVEVGSIGERLLTRGGYAYTGSALGPGGFGRLDRHREVADGTRDVRHWHVDYLLGHDAARVVGDVRSPGADAECAVAGRLASTLPAVSGFGATDCDCDSHLVRADGIPAIRNAARVAHEAAPGRTVVNSD